MRADLVKELNNVTDDLAYLKGMTSRKWIKTGKKELIWA